MVTSPESKSCFFGSYDSTGFFMHTRVYEKPYIIKKHIGRAKSFRGGQFVSKDLHGFEEGSGVSWCFNKIFSRPPASRLCQWDKTKRACPF
jgi:hypothetical protein